MTVSSSNRKAGPFLGNGVTTAFPFAFKVFKTSDVRVTYTNANGVDAVLVLDSQYSVALNVDQDTAPGGTITYPTVASGLATLPAGERLTLSGGLALTQPTDIPNTSAFFAQIVEDGLDRAEIQIQQLQEQIDRAIKISVSDAALTPLPTAPVRANTLVGFDGLGNLSPYPVTASVGAGDMRVDTFVSGVDFTPGVTTVLSLSRPPGTPANAEVFFDPLFQGPDQWSVAGATLTFNAPIPLGVSKVFVRLGTALSTSVPPNGSVGDAQLTWGSVLTRVVATRADLVALDTTKYTRAYVLGYYAAGDRGAMGHVWFDPLSATADNGGSVTAPAIGAGRWKMIDTARMNPFQFGAKGDKITDDTVAIQACYNAVDAGGTFHLLAAPGLAYIVSKQGANNYVFDFSRFVNIEADGFFSALQPVAGTTVNTVLLKPVVNGGYWGLKWEGLTLGDPFTGTRAGLNGIFIDTQLDGSQLPGAIFRNLNVMTASVVGGVGILHLNTPAGANINGGMYGSSFEDCIVKGGFSLQASGDSNVIKRALISGPNVGVYFSLTSGASLLTLEDCNITSTGGAVLGDAGSRFKMFHCNCEQIQPFTQSISGFTTDVMVNLRGNNGTMSTPEIDDNHFGLFSGVPNAGVVRINNCIGGKADNNVLLNANTAPAGFVVSSSTNFRVGEGNTYGSAIVNTGAKVSDTATGTMGVYKPLAATLANAWVESGAAPTATAVSFKNCAGLVVVDGKLANGTVTPGTPFATLPVGHRPLEPREFPVVTYNAGTMTPGHVRVDTDGTMRIMAGQNQFLYLSGIRFMAADLADATSDL